MIYPSEEDNHVIMDEDITIGCPQHGEFITTPQNHLEGYGCPDCRHEHLIADMNVIFNRLEEHICAIENADEHESTIPVGSYQIVLYELSEKIKKLIGEKNE
jgi:hypothetical protein|tara:strand:+ start:703 stop:1008 length:306 start_codon:yes stop_codon:yes gene_type:complete